MLIDGVPVRPCLTPVGTVGPQRTTTVEGLARDGILHALQEAFLAIGALQCGYCTSGMLMSGVALLAKNPHPTDDGIVRFMDGNPCRGGIYARIVAAIKQAAARAAQGGPR